MCYGQRVIGGSAPNRQNGSDVPRQPNVVVPRNKVNDLAIESAILFKFS